MDHMQEEIETLRAKVNALEDAVDLAIADAMDRDDVDFAERLTEMAEG